MSIVKLEWKWVALWLDLHPLGMGFLETAQRDSPLSLQAKRRYFKENA